MTVQYAQFIETVEHESGVPREEAERAARATLAVLGERLSLGEADDIARELPSELAPVVRGGKLAQGFGVDDFVHRVALREDVDDAVAEAHARAVFAALGRALSDKELHDMEDQLSTDYRELLAATAGARREPLISADEFVQRVCERSPAPDFEAARRATEAVLEALAVRISGGEVEDLKRSLPADLHGPLQRGRMESGERAVPLDLDAFLQRVAERTGVDRDRARDGVRAVLQTLREVVPEKEVGDVLAQLPKEYRDLFA